MSDPSSAPASATAPAASAPSTSMAEAIAARRRALGTTFPQFYEKPAGHTGVAFSGGGIRSATLSLGIAQAFARNERLLDFDYCSTVSGGGYFGSFLTSLFLPNYIRGDAPREEPDRHDPEDQCDKNAEFGLSVLKSRANQEMVPDPYREGQQIRSPLWWLRQHSRYMAPNGPSDYQAAIAFMVRNWCALMFVLMVIAAMLFATSTATTSLIYAEWPQSADLFATATHPPAKSMPVFAHVSDGPLSTTAPARIAGRTDVSTATPLRWSVSPLVLVPLFGWAFSIALGQAYWLTMITRRGMTHWLFAVGDDARPRLPVLQVNLALLCILTGAGAWTLVAQDALSWRLPFALICANLAAGAFLQLLFASKMNDRFLPALETPASSAAPSRQDETAQQDETAPKGTADGLEPLVVQLRARMTRWLSWCMLGTTIGLALVLIGALGRAAYILVQHKQLWTSMTALFAVIPAASTVVAKVPQWFGGGRISALLGRQVWNLALIVALLLYGLVAIGVDVGIQAMAFGTPDWTTTAYWTRAPITLWGPTLWTWLGAALLFFVSGAFPRFLNLSSLSGLYGTRLTRAYLGATNLNRLRNPSGITESDPGDQIRIVDYQLAALCGRTFGPFHLINTTLNETISPTQSQLLERDRKGIPLVFAPDGVFAAVRKPVPGRPGPRPTLSWSDISEVEALSVGQLCAISGAAFSSGMGMNTTLGGSMLLTFANIRLGYWWKTGDRLGDPDAHVSPKPTLRDHLRRHMPPTYVHLYQEATGTYHRDGGYVNLSDGGHFENTGAYELLRRKVPTILVCDQGEDHRYAFEDLENLIRKARIDLGMEITVATPADVESAVLASGARLFLNGRPGDWRRRLLDRLPKEDADALAEPEDEAFCLLLRVLDCDDPDWRGHIVWMKPCLFRGLQQDLIGYARRNPTFPQQSTLNQFFDEAQWECYRELGLAMGERLLRGTAHGPNILRAIAKLGASGSA